MSSDKDQKRGSLIPSDKWEIEKYSSKLISRGLKELVKIKENESFENALRRFKKTAEETGLLSEIGEREHSEKPITRKVEREQQRGGMVYSDSELSQFDVTPVNLSYEGDDGLAITIFKHNTVIPAKKTILFSTAADGQTQIEIHILQGVRPFAADNRTLARIIISGIPPAPRGVPQIEVTFHIDANGIVNISVKYKATGHNLKTRIMGSSGLSENEIKKLFKEAEKHADEDRKRLKEIKGAWGK